MCAILNSFTSPDALPVMRCDKLRLCNLALILGNTAANGEGGEREKKKPSEGVILFL